MKKGFTLVELLAVIIILGVISLISAPLITRQIDNSKLTSYRSSVQNIIDDAKEYVTKNMSNSDIPEDGLDIKTLKLKKGNIKSGLIKRNENGEIEAINIYNGSYCASGTKSNIIVAKVNNEKDCETIDFTGPELKLKLVKATNTSIMINAYASDSQTDIALYTFQIGNEYIKEVKTNSKVASYEFTNLRAGVEYEITVTVKNKNADSSDSQYNNNTDATTTTKKILVKTLEVGIPTFIVSSNSYAKTKEVTINYPSIEGGVNSYKFDGKEIIVNGNEVKLDINTNGKLEAYTRFNSQEVKNSLNIFGIDDKGPEILSIDNPDTWEMTKVVTVVVKDTGAGLASKACSYDGGKSWISYKTNKSGETYCSQTFKENKTVDFLVKDKMGSITSAESFLNGKKIVINKVDNKIPTLNIGTVAVTSKSISIPYTTSDDQSGIDKITCKYSTKAGTYTTNATSVTNTNCMINNIAHNTTYYYQICAIDKAGNQNCKTGSSKTTALTVALKSTNTPTTAKNGYLTKQVWNLTTSGNPNAYYIKSTRAVTSSINLTKSCGTSTNPGTCSNITATKNMAANTWYYVTSKPSITYNKTVTSTATLYARITDGTNTTNNTSATVSKIDITAPTKPSITNPTNGNWTNKNFSLTVSSTDTGSGINYYQYSYDNVNFTTYASSASTKYTTTAFSAERNQNVYIRSCDYVGNCSISASTMIRIDKTGPTKPSIQLVQSTARDNLNWGNSYTSGSWTSMNVLTRAQSTDAASGISQYQYSHDGVNWTGDISAMGWNCAYYNNKTIFDYWITWDGQWNFYVRGVDNLGNAGPASNMFTLRIFTNQQNDANSNWSQTREIKDGRVSYYQVMANGSWYTVQKRSVSGWSDDSYQGTTVDADLSVPLPKGISSFTLPCAWYGANADRSWGHVDASIVDTTTGQTLWSGRSANGESGSSTASFSISREQSAHNLVLYMKGSAHGEEYNQGAASVGLGVCWNGFCPNWTFNYY